MKKSKVFLFGCVLLLTCSNLLLAETEYAFIGNKKCKKCHVKQYKAWKQTKMANVFDLLKAGVRADAKKKAGLDPQKDYTRDKQCLPCHTTGYGKKNGFVSIEETPNFTGVGCEMCHGAGGTYTQKQYMHLKNKKFKTEAVKKVGLISPVSEKTCTERCHNKKSPFFKAFNFAERAEQGIHKHFKLKYKH